MKVKTLNDNIMVDYKKVGKGEIIDLPDPIAKRYLTIGLVESIEDKQQLEPLIVVIDGNNLDLNDLSIKELYELSTKHELGVTQENKEVKASFAKRIFDAIKAKNKE